MTEPFRAFNHGYKETTTSPAPTPAKAEPGSDAEDPRVAELIKDMDRIKREIHERMGRVEANKLAQQATRDETSRMEALTMRVSEFQKAPRLVSSDLEHPIESRGVITQFDRTVPIKLTLNPAAPAAQMTVGDGQPSSTSSTQTLPETERCGPESEAALLSATELLAQAKEAWKQADITVREAKRLLEESTNQLEQARLREDKASSDLRSTQQELTTVYQFAAVAAKRQQDASKFFSKSNRWAIASMTMAWLTVVWVVWFSFHARLNILIPAVSTVAIALIGLGLDRWTRRDD